MADYVPSKLLLLNFTCVALVYGKSLFGIVQSSKLFAKITKNKFGTYCYCIYICYTNTNKMTLQSITVQMNILEIEISRQQQYIAKHGETNDRNSDKQWEQYKQDAEYNLQKWDMLKAKRDQLKQAA